MGTSTMHIVVMIATMIAAGVAVFAYVAQRGAAALVPLRIKARRS